MRTLTTTGVTIDIKSGDIGIIITHNQDTAVPFPYN